MTTLTLDLPPELYQSLETEASQQAQTPAALVQKILQEHLRSVAANSRSERTKIEQVLSNIGALTELGPTLTALADPTILWKK